MTATKTILTAFLFLYLSHLQAQQPAFYHLSTAEGLSDNNVSTVIRDRNGILWIATTEGLNSFDGNRISTYNKYNQPELPDNRIERIVEDERNRLWIRTVSHYIVMLDEKRKFHRILVGSTADSSQVTTILFARNRGIIAIKGKQHYLLVDGDRPRFEKLAVPFEAAMAGPSGFTYLPDNDWAIYYRGGHLIVVDYSRLKLLLRIPFPGISGAQYINPDELITFKGNGDVFHRIRISTGQVVKEYRNIRDQFGLPITGTLRNMTRIDSTRFAFTTFFAGLYILDLQKESVLHCLHDPVDPRSIGGNNTLNIRYDTSGYLFVTTQTSGLHFFNMNEHQAATKPYFADAGKQVFDGYIQSITADSKSNLWMGAQDRLIRWDKTKDQASFPPLLLPDGTNISGQETIRCLNFDEDGRLWAGSSRYGILVLNQQLQTIRRITDSVPGSRTGFPSPLVNAICPDKQGNRWAGTIRGTCIIRKDDFGIVSLKEHPLLRPVSGLSCTVLWKDRYDRMWIGTTSGAWCYDEARQSLAKYDTSDGLSHNTIAAFNEDDRGNIYIGTLGGLSILSKDGKITSYDRSNGLRNDRCEGILKDEQGFIWIGNLSCILRYDPSSRTFAVFEEGMGFSHAGFRMRSAYTSASGEMFWGTDKGLIHFFPGQMSRSALPLRPFIHTLQVGNQVFRFTGSDASRFPYYTSSFVFTFSSGELSGDKKNQLRYRLRGFDNDWHTPATIGQAVYSKLPPGKYVFEVKASRDGITWYESPYNIRLVVTAPWWRQTWFRLLCIALAAGLAGLIYFNLRKKKKAREALQKNKEELMLLSVKMAESRFLNLRLQMNPHFLFNSLSSIQHLIVSRQTNKSYKYLTVFSNFLRSLLNFAEKNFIPLDEELKILRMYVELESLRFDESFSWEVRADEGLLNDEVLVPTLMVQPFAENAIWHGLLHKEGEKKLSIRFAAHSDEFLSCTIEDNGIGREKALSIRESNIHAKMRESKGIAIIQQRLELLQQKTGKPASVEIEDLEDASGRAAGTRVRIIIPYYNPEET